MEIVPKFSYAGQFSNAYYRDSVASLGWAHHTRARDTPVLGLLERAAQRQAHNGITFCDQKAENGYFHLSYQNLLDRVKINCVILLRNNAIQARKPVLMAFEKYQDSIIWYWSIIAAGGIPALLPPKRGGLESWKKELQHINELLRYPATFTDKASLEQFTTAGGFNVMCQEDLLWGNEESEELEYHLRRLGHRAVIGEFDETCTILFTSGSTGPSKGVCFSHRQLLVSSFLKCHANNMNHNDRFLCWISFDHSVALCELHLHAMEAAANMVVMPSSEFTQDPVKFWRVLSDEKISYTFAPNSFLAAALRANGNAELRNRSNPQPEYDFRQLKVIFCGGEANKTSTLNDAMNFLCKYRAPASAVTAVYGLSETCSALFYNRNSPAYDFRMKNSFASVGVPLPGHRIRIVDKHGQHHTCANSAGGSVQISGPMVFSKYYNNAEATDACTTADGWFDTGDLGSLDSQGNLVISGRTKDVLILNGQNYSCGDLEYSIENCGIDGLEPGYTVSFTIWQEKADTEEVVILFNPSDDQMEESPKLRNLVEQITQQVASFCKARPHIVVPLPRRALPRSSIGKLSRAKLRSSFLAGEFDGFKLKDQTLGNISPSFTDSVQAAIARVFSESLNIPQASLSPDLPIEYLGIDSLSFLKLLSGIEQTLSLAKPISLRETISCNTIRKMATMISQNSNEPESVPYTPVELLHSTGTKTPLVLCHTGNGGFLNYLGLLPLIPDRKIMALHAPAPATQQKPFDSLKQMLDKYVEAIKREQSSGPYSIFGFCFGGILAFELTKRLEAMGDDVVFCGGLDSPVDISVMRDPEFSRETVDERHHLMSLLLSVNLVRREEVPFLLAKLGSTPRQEVVKEIASILTQAKIEDAGLSEEKLQAWVTMSSDIHRLALDYHPGGSVRTFDAFYAASPPIGANVPDATRWRYVYIGEWKNYVEDASNNDVCFDYEEVSTEQQAGRPLRLHCVPGTHETMMMRGNIDALGKKINDMLLLRENEWCAEQAYDGARD